MGAFDSIDSASESLVSIAMPPSMQQLGGQLRYDPDSGISVNLVDTAGDTTNKIWEGTIEQYQYPVILGRMLSGVPFTLLDCVIQSSQSGGGGFAGLEITASKLLVGIHLESPQAKPFDELRVSLTSLNEWFAVSPITYDIKKMATLKPGQEFTISYKRFPQFGFSPLGGGSTLMSHQNPNISHDRFGHTSIRNAFTLGVVPRSPFGIESCANELFRLQAFLSLLCGHQVFYKSIRLYRHDLDTNQREREPVNYVAWVAQPAQGNEKRHVQILLQLPVVHDVLAETWTKWTQRYDCYKSAVELYTSTEMFHGQLLNFEFLAIMQALETLHRNRFGGTYLPGDEYCMVSDTLADAIPRNIPSDLRNALQARLKYGNDFSFQKRLNELIHKLSSSISLLIHPDMKGFLERARCTRNYLTHYDAKGKDNVFQDSELYWATRLLRRFFLSLVLIDIGVPDTVLVKALSLDLDLAYIRTSVDI